MDNFFTDQSLMFAVRLLLAGLLGFAIGIDREYRAKEAGVRTHFLVSMGSCLIMIVSQWGFSDVPGVRGDPGRIAAQIVSGIGFIGAGTIMVHKQFVRGLTTAAGLWVSAGIGMAVGGGLYLLGIMGTILALIGMELLPLLVWGIKTKTVSVTFTTSDRGTLSLLTERLMQENCKVISSSVNMLKDNPERFRVQLLLRIHPSDDKQKLQIFLEDFPDVLIEKVE